MGERFKFLEAMKQENFVYKFLTRFCELNSLKNINFLMETDKELEVDFDNPEIEQITIIMEFHNYIVVQDGKILKRVEEYDPSIEALALSPRRNNKYYEAFLCRAVS